MNPQVLRALFKDALYQVLDNKVFRLLVIAVVLLVLPTFLVAARPDELVILWGWKSYFYEDIFTVFGLPYPGKELANQQLIQVVQTLIVDSLGGTLGIVFAISATAFFMPRMVEKGAADILFSKPVSRFALMLSRYAAGLLFVGILAILLVGGMHLGLTLNSGYSDPGFLWSIPVLIYLYAILHAFSILISILTRSTVAAILMTLLFFVFNGCVHSGWTVKEFAMEEEFGIGLPERTAEQVTKEEQEITGTLRVLMGTLDALHYTLPKTSDADIIARKLRRSLEMQDVPFYDDEIGLKVMVAPKGFVRARLPEEESAYPALVRWSRPQPGGRTEAYVTIRSCEWERDIDDKWEAGVREGLAARPPDTIRDVETSLTRTKHGSFRLRSFSWIESTPEEERLHEVGYFFGGGRFNILEIEGEVDWIESEELQSELESFRSSIIVGENDLEGGPMGRIGRRYRFGGPLKYNLWFSIGSSLAFIVVALGFGWWRLSRIDF